MQYTKDSVVSADGTTIGYRQMGRRLVEDVAALVETTGAERMFGLSVRGLTTSPLSRSFRRCTTTCSALPKRRTRWTRTAPWMRTSCCSAAARARVTCPHALDALEGILPYVRGLTFAGLRHSGPDDDSDPARVAAELLPFFS
ncbi:MAG TPA: hypothetical protein VGI56_02705 [Galbitalea sp.]